MKYDLEFWDALDKIVSNSEYMKGMLIRKE
ncbi:hypothetical protein L323_14365 [Ruminiclostridium papyrosolvens C7]|uniref:Uncharacterized protein n=1 Tax=Ruminiclostridium papyrosolvens C7 TaxID=1330534 RepID=U4R0E8_9FIRM|nr:hypothetical protein L323_14365 [Ruminiclostridium papyrosolvens C7]